MLSDREVREIEEGRRRGMGGPVLMTWVERLLADWLLKAVASHNAES